MPYYLAPYVGAGTKADPYRPRGSNQPGWKAIDLRPDASAVHGGGLNACLLYLPAHDPDVQLELLADELTETLSGGRLARVRTRLGLPDLEQAEFSLVIARILLRPPVNGWKRLLATRGRYLVFLNGLVADLPVVQAATDNFNRADETPLGAPWAELAGSTGDVNLVSNAVQKSGSDGDLFVYYSGASTSADQFSQATQVTGPTADDWGPAVRIGADGFSGYVNVAFEDGEQIFKIVAGSFTQLLLHNDPVANGDTVRIEAEGSSVRGFINGAPNTGSPVTDTSLTTAGNGPGLLFFTSGGAIDDWAGGDLAALGVSSGRRYKRLVGPQQLPTSTGDLYTVPAGTVTQVRHVHVSNPGASPVDVTLGLASGTLLERTVGADSVYSPRNPIAVTLAAGEVLQGSASAAGVVVVVDGVERTV